VAVRSRWRWWLAAARVTLVPPQAPLRRLERRLPLLRGGARDLPARQQILRSVLAWSYALLAPREPTLVARLAVFAGGCTWEAAEAVCTPTAAGALDVQEGVASLVDQSLLQHEEQAQGELRFWMLEMRHQDARERLEAGREAATMQRRHTRRCTTWR
jgi:predicted ATPase